MASKEASFARIDSGDPLDSSAETTPDFDALERAAESIRPAWDGLAAPLPSVPPAPLPAQVAPTASPSAADSTHRMRAQLPPSAQLDDLDDLALPKKGRSWLAPAVIGGIVVVGLAAMFFGSSEPAAPAAELAPVVTSAPPAQPTPAEVVPEVAPSAAPAPIVAPTPVEPAAVAQPPEPAVEPAPVVEKVAEPVVDRLAAARAKRREKRTTKPVLAKPVLAKAVLAKAVLAKKPEPVRKPAAPVKPAEVKPRKGVGFVSDNPY